MYKPGSDRHPLVDGLFYPSQEEELKQALSLDPALEQSSAIIVPHGGYTHVLKHLQEAFSHVVDQKPELIILIGPTHREPEDHIFYPDYVNFESPLGLVPVASELTSQLKKPFTRDKMNHMEEFSLEILLPFVREYFPDKPVLPLLMGKDSMKLVKEGKKQLQQKLPEKTLYIISSNLSPHDRQTEEWALNNSAWITKGDYQSLMEISRKSKKQPCGLGPLLFVKELLPSGHWKTCTNMTCSTGDSKRGLEVWYQSFWFDYT
ncbi:AmmeMemoRadiSam system protein B [Spirochaeta cellobiosiphila]|uniref:AmmeMemoRadiSam system protein B n=1 Tax=Spirochaeta cellobiosiphila TaxID=504483 RepID=UPI000410BF1F|nr:AmmeMemoRadiSam system protein B [Spirochaeta cellobiosiphila]